MRTTSLVRDSLEVSNRSPVQRTRTHQRLNLLGRTLDGLRGRQRVFEQDFPEFVSLRSEVKLLTARVGTMENDKAKSQEIEQAREARIANLENQLALHASTLTRFFDHIRDLEEATLEVRSTILTIC